MFLEITWNQLIFNLNLVLNAFINWFITCSNFLITNKFFIILIFFILFPIFFYLIPDILIKIKNNLFGDKLN